MSSMIMPKVRRHLLSAISMYLFVLTFTVNGNNLPLNHMFREDDAHVQANYSYNKIVKSTTACRALTKLRGDLKHNCSSECNITE